MKVNCSVCNTIIDMDTMAASAKVVGWVDWKNGRPHGSVKEWSSPVGWAHQVCLTSRLDQDALF